MNQAMGACASKPQQVAVVSNRFYCFRSSPSLPQENTPQPLPVKMTASSTLLWFAAGGGKTEAFMGIILWQAFFDRLRGKQFGNTAFIRFPLRLLTFQQLQRLAGALAAAELIRKEEAAKGRSI